MKKIPKVITDIVQNDLCIGCGMCTYVCPEKALEMEWNEYGFLVPHLKGSCNSEGCCTDVCPFNLNPKIEVRTENEIANLFLPKNQLYHPRIGKYTGIYVGHANENRLSSSSGGMATYISTRLIEEGIVDHIFAVRPSSNEGNHYEYSICSTEEEIQKGAKTRYYPVSLNTVLSKIDELEGKVAIVGVACFIKSIRLAQYENDSLREKIPFLIGIICGGN